MSAPALVGSASGDSEKSIRALFDQAVEECKTSPRGCIILIDEIDVITPKRETAQREMERRMVAQLLSCMDELSLDQCGGKPVLVIGATNRPDSIDAALRRAGRFDREIEISVPEKDAREHILRVMTSGLRMSGDFNFADLATKTPGYVGADFRALVNEAALYAVSRGFADVAAIAAATAPPTENAVDSISPPIQTSADDTGVQAMDTSEVNGTDSTTSISVMRLSQVPIDASTNSITSGMTSYPSNIEDSVQVSNMETRTDCDNSGMFNSSSTLNQDAPSQSQREAASATIRACIEPFSQSALAGLYITAQDFNIVLPRVQPSAKREGFATIPEVTWDDVGALNGPRQELEDAVVLPLKYPELSRRMGIPRPPGVLLHGPPGCGKTLLAKAVANSTHANFISVKGPELLNKFVGESERAVRLVFQRARTSSPCIVFFDEFDALCPIRENDSSTRNTQRLVNQLLTEMDGFDAAGGKQVFIIAATNRPDIVDPAIMRPGRLDKLVYVDLPNALAREEILNTHTRKLKLSDDVKLHEIASDKYTGGFTGADLAAVTREAGIANVYECVCVCV